MVANIVFHVSSKYQIDPRSYVSGVALQNFYDINLLGEDMKTNFEVKQIQFGKTWRSLKIVKCIYIMKTFIQKFGM